MSENKMTGLDEGHDESVLQRPETITFQGHSTYLLNDLIRFDRAFFVGCIREAYSTTNTGLPSTANETIHGLRQPPKTRKPESLYLRIGFITIFPNLQEIKMFTNTNRYHP